MEPTCQVKYRTTKGRGRLRCRHIQKCRTKCPGIRNTRGKFGSKRPLATILGNSSRRGVEGETALQLEGLTPTLNSWGRIHAKFGLTDRHTISKGILSTTRANSPLIKIGGLVYQLAIGYTHTRCNIPMETHINKLS